MRDSTIVRSRLFLNHDGAYDWLIALEFGVTDDGQHNCSATSSRDVPVSVNAPLRRPHLGCQPQPPIDPAT